MQTESYESIVRRRTAEFSVVGSQILSIAYSPMGGATPERTEEFAQLLEPGGEPLLEEPPSFFPYFGSRNATYIGEYCVAYKVCGDSGKGAPFWLLWDLRPLQPESWENIYGFIGGRMFDILMETGRGQDDSGDNVIDMQCISRTPQGDGVPSTDAIYMFVGDYFHPDGQVQPEDRDYPKDDEEFNNGQWYVPSGVRRCYIPTWFHADLVRSLFPRRRCERGSEGGASLSMNPCAPPWPRIENELIRAGFDRSQVVDMTAPALIELLAEVRGVCVSADTGNPQAVVQGDSAQSAEDAPTKPTHSADFTSVSWFGTRYTFAKGNQAESIRLLWEAWEIGEHGLAQETIAERVRTSATRFELAKVFRRRKAGGGYQSHPAWGTMIQVESKGVYRLVPPDCARVSMSEAQNPQ